ncbi:RNA polymerase sigma factor [Actinomadura rupiterrae]|uniref:RNA polymerase sigma factor n=1 Tax=Actinomadura rupiterrae TaxID=559627 RepID=UPI0020A5CCBC|nr:sigma factor-like helix-turn-helix DNA-binding protein [Actinomadura rupiterrae]MCP2339057.1 RNA polymerase sigma-70 factor (ECF subfamily) [Actinomadura rupiterrae]
MAKDDASFAEFYRGAYPSLVAELYACTGDRPDAQEVAQEAFMRAWSQWGRVRDLDHPRAWVARVAYRLAASRWRRTAIALRALRRHGPPPDVPPPDGASVYLVSALAKLPEPQRRALVMHHMGGYTISEIAAVEGVANGTVKARLSRGRTRLAALLDDSPSHPAEPKEARSV